MLPSSPVYGKMRCSRQMVHFYSAKPALTNLILALQSAQ
jgi:hypothetical protein